MNRAFPVALLPLLAPLLLICQGCIERSLQVKSNPPGARVFFDGNDKGVTPTEFDFKWYGGHKLTLEKDGYVTQSKLVHLSAPLHHKVPLDLVTAVVPVKSGDKHAIEFNLEPEAHAAGK